MTKPWETTNEEQQQRVGRTSAILNSLGQGLSLGFSDELAAGLSATANTRKPFADYASMASQQPREAFAVAHDDPAWRQNYDAALERERANLQAGREQHPWASGIGEVGGAIGTGVAGGLKLGGTKTAQALARFMPKWLQMAALGAAEGGVYGAGAAEEGERLEGAATGAAFGAVAAPVTGYALGLGGRVLKGAGNAVNRVFNNTPNNQAVRAIRQAMEWDGFTPATAMQRLDELGPDATLADLGENLRTTLQAAQSRAGPGRELARTFLDSRQRGQQMRLINAAAGGNLDTKEFRRGLYEYMTNRESRAAPFYDRAYAAPFDATSPRMQALTKRPMIARAIKKAETRLANEGGGAGHVRLLDAAKRELDAMYEQAVRGAKPDRDLARIITKNKNLLLKEMDDQVPDYAKARSIFSGEAGTRSAIEQGRALFTRRTDLDIVEDTLRQMSEGERHAFRVGALRGLIEKLDATPENRNAAGKMFEGTRARELLKLAFPSEEVLDRFMRQANADDVFSYTRRATLGGSPTQPRQEAGKALDRATGAFAGLREGRDMTSIVANMLIKLGLGDEVSEETLEQTVKMLLSTTRAPQQLRRVAGQPRIRIPQSSIQSRAGVAAGTNALLNRETDRTDRSQ